MKEKLSIPDELKIFFRQKLNYFLGILVFLPLLTFAQEINIVPYLKSIEQGNEKEVISSLSQLKQDHPNDPSVIFLDAVLTENGKDAEQKYAVVYEQYPKSNYADAALYRVFSYYYSLGVYNKAESLLNKLKKDYPASPYIKAADRTIPDETLVDARQDAAPAVKQPEPPAPQTGNYNFTIQAGAFLNIENANNLMEEIKKDGYPAELSTKSVGGSLLNVVTFGRLEREDQAAPLFEYLKKKFNLNGRIISVN